MSLGDQADEALNIILKKADLPFSEQIRIRAVSKGFCAVIESSLAKETSLALSVKETAPSKLTAKDLVIKATTTDGDKRLFQLLARLFPGITHLDVAFPWQVLWEHVPTLLHQMSHLTSLKLDGMLLQQLEVSTFEAFAESLNALASLTCLWLEADGPYYRIRRLLPTLSRLERFFFYDSCSIGVPEDDEGNYKGPNASFLASALSPRCTHLELNKYNFDYGNDAFLDRLSSQLKYLHVHNCTGRILDPVSEFLQLTSLTLEFDYNQVHFLFLHLLIL